MNGDLARMEQRHSGHQWVLLLWSVECPPCYRELSAVGKLLTTHPDLAIEIIATDTPANLEQVRELLAEFGLQSSSTWYFASNNSARLRYSIDPEWMGTLPRSYLYAADGSRHAMSGLLEEEQLLAHFQPKAATTASLLNGL